MVAMALEPSPLWVAMVRLESICWTCTSCTSGIEVLLRNEVEVCGVEYQVRDGLMVGGGMEGRGWVFGMEDAEKLNSRRLL